MKLEIIQELIQLPFYIYEKIFQYYNQSQRIFVEHANTIALCMAISIAFLCYFFIPYLICKILKNPITQIFNYLIKIIKNSIDYFKSIKIIPLRYVMLWTSLSTFILALSIPIFNCEQLKWGDIVENWIIFVSRLGLPIILATWTHNKTIEDRNKSEQKVKKQKRDEDLKNRDTKIRYEQDLIVNLWKESLSFYRTINDKNSFAGSTDTYDLTYFGLFIYFERVCSIYYSLQYKTSKELFHRLFDNEIEHTLRQHLKDSLHYLSAHRNKFLFSYGYKHIAWYLYELNRDIVDNRRKLSHSTNWIFNFDQIFWDSLKEQNRFASVYSEEQIEQCEKIYQEYIKLYKTKNPQKDKPHDR